MKSRLEEISLRTRAPTLACQSDTDNHAIVIHILRETEIGPFGVPMSRILPSCQKKACPRCPFVMDNPDDPAAIVDAARQGQAPPR